MREAAKLAMEDLRHEGKQGRLGFTKEEIFVLEHKQYLSNVMKCRIGAV